MGAGYWSAALCALWLLVYLYWRVAVAGYWRSRGVPTEPAQPHPVLGSLTMLYRINFGSWMRQVYERHRSSPYIGMWLFWRPALVVHSPELAGKILVKDSQYFRDHGFGVSASVDPMGALNVLVLKEPVWSQVRRRLTSLFTSAKLRALHPVNSTKAKQLVQRIDKHNNDNDPLELRSLFADFSTDIISASVLGVTGDATLTGESELRTVTRHFMHFSVWRGFCWATIFFWPALATICRCTMFPRSATDLLRRLMSQARGGDLVPALHKIKEDGDNGRYKVSDDLLVAQGVILVQGGFDTTASTLTFVVYELAYSPHVQKRLYEELKAAADSLGHADFDSDTLANCAYLKACIKEALRKYPPLGWLERRCSQPYRLDDKLTIEAGTTVFVNGNGLHYDERYFPDPETYNPERFMPQNEANIPNFTYMPFGEGPRVCTGMRFAEQSVRYALARVLLHFLVRPAPGQPAPHQVQFEKRGLLIMPGQPLYVTFEPRT